LEGRLWFQKKGGREVGSKREGRLGVPKDSLLESGAPEKEVAWRWTHASATIFKQFRQFLHIENSHFWTADFLKKFGIQAAAAQP